ncbi:Vacuolar protein sorting-associated protein 52 [Dipsacomyces acuminosporus]|nr:Vacuolar protein sorting-associated protein 52 [Dipsacomyces acuminosporus]
MAMLSRKLVAAFSTRPYSAAASKLSSCRLEDMVCVDHLVIGAGVVGLAVGRQLSQRSGTSTLVVEKNRQFGMETSSRNSEVIHAGIYYPKDSLRTRLCIDGKNMLYEYCKQRDIPHKQVGKWVVAQNESQSSYLYNLAAHCASIDVPAQIISQQQAQRQEPFVRAQAALVSPTTGIIDTHAYMSALHQDIVENGGDLALNTKVLAIQKEVAGASGYRVLVSTGDPKAPLMAIKANVIVNAAGLWADRIASMPVPESHPWRTRYKLHFAKGRYYSYLGTRIKVNRLIYPVPDKHITSLGTHLTLDMAGAIRFGPDFEWVSSNTDYDVSGGQPLGDVVAAVASYLPSIQVNDLALGYTGIRPKLQPPGGKFHDFVVQEESASGMPGFVNLVGIESPGLTSSLAVARMVEQLVY